MEHTHTLTYLPETYVHLFVAIYFPKESFISLCCKLNGKRNKEEGLALIIIIIILVVPWNDPFTVGA